MAFLRESNVCHVLQHPSARMFVFVVAFGGVALACFWYGAASSYFACSMPLREAPGGPFTFTKVAEQVLPELRFVPQVSGGIDDSLLVTHDGTTVLRVTGAVNGASPLVEVLLDNKVVMRSPKGLWSVASAWQDQWPSNWHDVAPSKVSRSGEWLVLSGVANFPTAFGVNGTWHFQDSYRLATAHGNLIEARRRWTWIGAGPARQCSLVVRWIVPRVAVGDGVFAEAESQQVVLPGILYNGNPAGMRTRRGVVPQFIAGREKEKAVFEEHRFPAPYVAVESARYANDDKAQNGAALHTIPSQVAYGNAYDQWWSLGAISQKRGIEMLTLSGPVSLNGINGVVKANQNRTLPYANAWMDVPSNAVIEKRFFLEIYSVRHKGNGFRTPLWSAMLIHNPLSVAGLPQVVDIVSSKLQFAAARWFENDLCAGYRMYSEVQAARLGRLDHIVMGWAGQADATAFSMMVLGAAFGHKEYANKGRRAMNFLSSAPMSSAGFPVRYVPNKQKWQQEDHLSQGQALLVFTRAISFGRRHGIDTLKWEEFLRAASHAHAVRILRPGWVPLSTSEGYLVAALASASGLLNDSILANASQKAGKLLALRHRTMSEPYWGGTLDASCEDKEGAWAAFQSFLSLFELTKDSFWLEHASHAMDVVLTYTYVWDVGFPPSRLNDNAFKTRGWTSVSVQNMHLDVFGVLFVPELLRMSDLLQRPDLKKLAEVMYRSCGQMLDPHGSQGEQLQQTNFAQQGNLDDVSTMRGGYSEEHTVLWIAAHFLHTAAVLFDMGLLTEWMQ